MKYLKNLIISIILIVIIFIGLEIIFRIVYKKQNGISFSDRSNLFIENKEVLYQPKPKYKDKFISISKRGFRENLSKLTNNSIQIAAIGSSETMGTYLTVDQTYLYILSNLLTKKFNKSFYPINAAINGSNSYHTYKWFKNFVLPKTNLKYLIIYTGNTDVSLINELKDKWKPDLLEATGIEFTKAKNKNRNIIQRLKYIIYEYSAFISWVRRIVGTKFFAMKQKKLNNDFNLVVNNKMFFNSFKNNLQNIIDLCKEKNIKVYLIQIPLAIRKKSEKQDLQAYKKICKKNDYQMLINWYQLFLKAQPKLNQKLSELTKNSNVKLIKINDFLNNFSPEKRIKFFKDINHLSISGNKLLAEQIFKIIKNDTIK